MSHEYPLKELPDTPLWVENYAFMFVDPIENITIFGSCGRWYADTSVWREVIGISLPGGRVLASRNYGRGIGETGPAAALASWDALEPEKRLRLRFDGPMRESPLESWQQAGWQEGPMKRCTIDLEFNAVQPLWNMKGTSAEALAIAGGMHVEQIGSVSGTLVYDKTYVIKDAYSIRDHSRGVRDPKDFYRYTWLSGNFPESGVGFYTYMMQLRDGGAGMGNAVVSIGQKLYDAKIINQPSMTALADGENLPEIVLESALGEMRITSTRRVGRIPVSFWNPFDCSIGFVHHVNSTSIFADGLVLSLNGREGTGWCERGLAVNPL